MTDQSATDSAQPPTEEPAQPESPPSDPEAPRQPTDLVDLYDDEQLSDTIYGG